MMNKILPLQITIALLFLYGCNGSRNMSGNNSPKGLKDYYADYFSMGVAVSSRALKTDEAGLILREFGSLTAENAMKMEPIHPRENEYYWSDADSIAAFAKRNNLKLRGHCLVWHNQAPAWMFKEDDGKVVSKEKLLQRMKDHISTVVKDIREPFMHGTW